MGKSLGILGKPAVPPPPPPHAVHIVYSKMDAAKEFPHRDESGAAETVCCPIFTVRLHWPLRATSATFFAPPPTPLRNISISLAVRECCGTHTAGAQIKRNRCVQFARAAHFGSDIAAPRMHRLINILLRSCYQRPNRSRSFISC